MQNQNIQNTIYSKAFEINIDTDRTLDAEIKYNNNHIAKPLAVVLHGFKGNKDWGFLPNIAELFARNKYIAVSYNHSLNGKIPNSMKYNIDKFRKITVSEQLRELSILMSHLMENVLTQNDNPATKWNGEIVLIGHSMGAAIALLYATENTVAKLMMLSPISKFNRYTDRQRKQWRAAGFMEFFNPKTEQTMALDATFIDDMDENLERFDLTNAIAKCKSEILIIHGEQDVTVRIAEARELFANSDKAKCRLIEYPNCNHSFNIDTLGYENNHILKNLMDDLEAMITNRE